MVGEIEIMLIGGEGMNAEAVTQSLRNAGILNRVRVVRENPPTNAPGSLVVRNSIDFPDIIRMTKQQGIYWLLVSRI